MERFSPRLTDKITYLLGFNQLSDEPLPPNAPDGLFEPTPELNTVEGRFSDQQLMSDPYSWAKTNTRKMSLMMTAIGGLIGGFLAYKTIRKSK